jgi:hypothetical protein
MRRSWFGFAASGVLLVASVGLTSPSARPTSANAAASIGFETPSVVDSIHTNGEPDIGLDKFGRVFVSGPTGTGTQRSTWFGSVDGGHTFRVMAQKRPPDSIINIPAPGPGGGDTDINFDRSGKQYFADLWALTCVRTATTTNGGATDFENPDGCGTSLGADRQWFAVYDPAPGTPNKSVYTGPRPLIYLEFNNLIGPYANGGAYWIKSNAPVLPGDPGLTYTNAMADVTPPITQGVYSPFGPDGYPAIDQVTGKVFQAAGFQDSNGVRSLRLNIGTPDTNGNLTFLDSPTPGNPNGTPSNLVTIANNLPDSPDTLFTVLSIDTARNLYAVWALNAPKTKPGQRQVFVSAASAASGWTAWTPAVQVSDGSTGTGDATNVFPWIKAGGPGRADAVWYGSDQQVDPSSHNNQVWNVFMNQVVFPTNATGAVTGAAATTTLVKVTPHPMHYDDVCLLGSACVTSNPPGNRNLADFFEVNVDSTGAAEIVYDDTSNKLVQQPNPNCMVQVADHCGAGVITIARQSSGPGLFGTSVSGPSNAPVSGLNDPAGDALFPVIGGSNQRGMDIRSSQLRLDGQTLTVTMQVVNLSNPAATIVALAGAMNVQYLTRWQMGNTVYYAAMENTALNQPTFYAGAGQSIDLCSVSACFPHVLTYPESPGHPGVGPMFTGKPESGTIACPASPSAEEPCTLTIKVNVADVGSPTANSLLEEVGGYALAAFIQEGNEDNVSAQTDTVPLEIDGVCCYNFQASINNGGPPGCHEADGDGDVSDGRGGKAHMRFDEDGCEDGNPESIQESDSSTGDNFQSDKVSSVMFNDALSNMTVLGTGTHNGNPVTFTLVAVNGAAGVGAYSLALSDGYSVSGTLLDGSIQLQ